MQAHIANSSALYLPMQALSVCREDNFKGYALKGCGSHCTYDRCSSAGLHFTYPQDKQKALEAAALEADGSTIAYASGSGHPEAGGSSGPAGSAVRGPPGDERQRLIAAGERNSAATVLKD